MSKKNTDKKSGFSAKIIAIIAAAVVAVVALVVILLNDGIPDNARSGLEAEINRQLGYSVKAVDCEKKYEISDSDADTEKMYLVSCKLKQGDFGDRLENHYCLSVLSVVTDNGEEKISCRILGTYEERSALRNAIKEYKDSIKAE